MAAHGGAVLALVVCGESGHILSGGADGKVKTWTEFQVCVCVLVVWQLPYADNT